MPNTIPDVSVSDTQFVDVNALSGIAAGTALVISNKSTSRILIQLAGAQPADDSTDGEILSVLPPSTAIKFITVGESTVWAKSLGSVDALISIQDNT